MVTGSDESAVVGVEVVSEDLLDLSPPLGVEEAEVGVADSFFFFFRRL